MKGLLARGAVWIAATRGAINLIGFCSTLLLARLLIPEDFGLVAIATTVIAIVTSVTEISLSSALVQHRDPTDAHYHTAFTLGLIRAAIVALITGALAWPIAALYGDDRLIALILALAAASAVSGLVNPKLVQLLRALVFRQEFVLGVSNKLVGFVLAAGVAIVWQSYWALVVGAAASQVCHVIVSYTLVRYRPRLSLSKTKELLSFSVWLTLSQVVSTLNYRFDTLFIGYFLGKAPLGLYSFGDNLANMVTREATSPVANTLFPAFSRMADDPDRLRAAYFKAQGMLFAIALPVGVGFALIAEPLILYSLGEKWRDAILVVQVIAASTGIASIGATYMPLALALGKTQAVFNRDLSSFVTRIPIIGIGLFLGGLVGIVLARLITGLIYLGLNMTMIRSLVSVRIQTQFAVNWRPIFAVCVMTSAILLFKMAVGLPSEQALNQVLMLAAEIGIGGVAYVLALWSAWWISGRPDGPEKEVARAARNILSRTKPERADTLG